jgi:glyoxylase-like metal-dependent hydrolase (beta-lactamase superfamily II)
MGFEPTGSRVDVTGVDLVRVGDGRITAIDAYLDGADLARQLGALPPQGSTAEARMAQAFNLTTRVKRRIATGAEPVADGVWVVRGGFPSKTMNVFLIRDGDGVMLFDAGIKAMTSAVAAAGASLGGITRVVLGHGHPDHRGVAPGLGVPVLCHPDNREDAEGDGGWRYFDFSQLKPYARPVYPHLLRLWDGGPVEIAETVEEGQQIAGFEVVLLPGHAPGLIGLWRAADRLALTSDCFYTLDPQTGRHGHPRVPHSAFNQDTEQARASIRKLAAMEPAAAWPGHADPLTGDVRSQLETAADTT